jgi:hypothetical protein
MAYVTHHEVIGYRCNQERHRERTERQYPVMPKILPDGHTDLNGLARGAPWKLGHLLNFGEQIRASEVLFG